MKEKILLLESEPSLRSSLVLLLERANYHVTPCLYGSECLEKLQSDSFDLVVMALKFPDIQGLDLLSQLRNLAPAMQVIVFSTDGSEKTIQGALRKGAAAYLVKPVEPETLLCVIDDLLHTQVICKSERVFR